MGLADDTLEVEQMHGEPRALRVGLVTETYPPEVNGVARTLLRAVQGLRQRHHEVQLIRPRQRAEDAPARGQGLAEVLMRGVPVPRYPDLRMGLPAKRALIRLWSLHRPDLVHIATEGPLGWSALQAAKQLKLPVTSDFRTNFHAYSRHYGMGWLNKPIVAYLRRFHNDCHVTMVPTRSLAHELGGYGFAKLRVLGRGVDTDLFHPEHRSGALRQSWDVDPTTPVLLYVGRLAPEKNLHALVDVMRAISQLGLRTRLVVVGDGPARQALQAQLPDAVFAGMQSGLALAAHYASGDILLFPSLTETFGNVTTEALASGLAVLAYDTAAAGEVIHDGVNGAIVSTRDLHAFAGRAVDLVAGAPALGQLRAAARATALGLSWDTVIDELVSILASVADGSIEPPRQSYRAGSRSWRSAAGR